MRSSGCVTSNEIDLSTNCRCDSDLVTDVILDTSHVALEIRSNFSPRPCANPTISSNSNGQIISPNSNNCNTNSSKLDIDSLNFLAWNVHGLDSIKIELHKTLFKKNHVIILSEAWTNDLSKFHF